MTSGKIECEQKSGDGGNCEGINEKDCWISGMPAGYKGEWMGGGNRDWRE